LVAFAAKFLLDANLSPRVARFLVEQFQLDVTSLQGQGLGELPDHEVIRLARQQGRVIITCTPSLLG
jgi:predicted nuclease of predicted toxin-antitoxin system